jgi:pimeloyl-ACP methyl ester carboxylesterase
MEKEIKINEIKTRYQTFGPASPNLGGEGKPFLILHGWNSNSDRWSEIAEKISAKGFKVIIPDLPGFGKSDPLEIPWNTNKYIDWIEKFVEELKLEEFYLLGHSFGGALASKMAVKYPQKVQKLFLVSAACVRKKTVKKGFFRRISKIAKLFYFIPYYPIIRKAVYKFIIRKSDYVYVEGIMKETYLNVVSEDLSFHLPFIKVSTIIIWGDKDDYTPISEGYFIERQIRKSKIIVIPGAAHDLNRKQPDILAQKVIENV